MRVSRVGVLQCGAVWCSDVQCGAVCFSLLQFFAVCCSMLQLVFINAGLLCGCGAVLLQ